MLDTVKRPPVVGDTVRFREYDNNLEATVLTGKVVKTKPSVCLVHVEGYHPPTFAVLNVEAEVLLDAEAEVKKLLDVIALRVAQDQGLGGQVTNAQAFINAQQIGRTALAAFGR